MIVNKAHRTSLSWHVVCITEMVSICKSKNIFRNRANTCHSISGNIEVCQTIRMFWRLIKFVLINIQFYFILSPTVDMERR